MAITHKRSPLGLLVNMTEYESLRTNAYRGTALADAIAGGIDLADWTLTFDEPCEDLSRVTNHAGAGPWYTSGIYPAEAIPNGVTFATRDTATYGAMCYTQRTASTWGLHVVRVGGANARISGISTGYTDFDDFSAESEWSHAQQYGYWEADIKIPDPNTNEDGTPLPLWGLLWPAFWFYSINQFGGTYGNMGSARMELDAFEMYPPNDGLTGNEKGVWRASFHKHGQRLFAAPGEWGRNGADDGNDIEFREDFDANDLPGGYAGNYATFGSDANFNFYDDFHLYGSLITPEWWILFCDRKEVTRFRMVTEAHQKYALLITSQIYDYDLGGTSPTDFDYPMEIESVQIWQNPEWGEVTGSPIVARQPKLAGGSANAYTWTTVAGSTGWTDQQTWVCRVPNANTGASTFNKDAAGAKSIVVGVVNPSNTTTTTPWLDPVTFRALVAGDLETGQYYAFKYDAELDAVLLLDEGRPQKDAGIWAGETPPSVGSNIPVLTIEAALAAKAGIIDLMEAGHPAYDLTHDQTAAGPVLRPNMTIQTVEGAAPGTIIGRVGLVNTPSQPAYFWMESSATFAIDPATGDVYVKSGGAVTQTTYELEVKAYCVPAVPTYLDANVCRLTIEGRENIDFSPDETFGSLLEFYYDFSDAANVTLASGDISSVNDLSDSANDAAQATSAWRPSYNPSGFNGFGSYYTTTTNRRLDNTRAFTSVLNFVWGYSAGKPRVIPVTSSEWVAVDTIDVSEAHIFLARWNSDGAYLYINGELIDLDTSPAVYPSYSGWLIAAVQATTASPTATLFAQNDLSGFIGNSSSRTTGLVGTIPGMLCGSGPLTELNRQRLEGLLAHEYWADPADVLPSTHPYVSSYPKQFT